MNQKRIYTFSAEWEGHQILPFLGPNDVGFANHSPDGEWADFAMRRPTDLSVGFVSQYNIKDDEERCLKQYDQNALTGEFFPA